MKQYTVKEVSRISGVTVRTLHFYDEIGLLKPECVGENGYRYYGREQLLSLQQILFYRRLGIPLKEIAFIMGDPRFDKREALRKHREILSRDAERLKELIRTLDKTLEELSGGKKMKDSDLYVGFSPEKQQEYESELIERFGEDARLHLQSSKEKTKNWNAADFKDAQDAFQHIVKELAACLAAGEKAESAAVQTLVAQHYRWICQFWKPSRDSYFGLGNLYREHADFRKIFESSHAGLADFLCESMRIYAEKNL